MLISTFVMLSFVLIAATVCALLYRTASFLLTIFFGKNINITYIDKNGFKQKKRIKLNNEDELTQFIEEIKTNAKNAGDILR